jgi:hypothetical protein
MEISKRQLQDEEVTAYHGGPHSFDKFSTQYMGTGEGAQAFGWGLYFTDLEDIAKTYAEKLFPIKFPKHIYRIALNRVLEDVTNSKFGSGGKREFFDKKKAIEIINQKSFNQELKDFLLDVIEKYDLKELKKNLYKVTLHKGKTPNQYTWLEWDKPLTDNQKKLIIDQSRKENLKSIKKISFGLEDTKISPESVITSFSPKSLGMEIYRNISAYFNSDKEASLFLLRAGIDGIKYPAESIAKGVTSDTARGFNYVVFDENAVNIEKQTQFEGMEISKRQLQENLNNIIYTAVFFATNEIVS